MDLYSRKIVGWHLSDNLYAQGVIAAINKAKKTRNLDNPVIIHSDCGVQYVSKEYLKSTPANNLYEVIQGKVPHG